MRASQNAPVLIVDDEPEVLESLELMLNAGGYDSVITCDDSRELISLLDRHPDTRFVLLDLIMPYVRGQDMLQALREKYPDLPIIVVTALDDLQTAVECMKKGAFDYLVKPVEKMRLLSTLGHALDRVEMARENRALKDKLLNESLTRPEVFEPIVTRNRKMLSIFKYAEAIAPSPEPVLITGETGVGKELIARAVHQASGRRGPFISVNIAGLDDEHLSDTLFGHLKGAFTGAESHRDGLVAKAAGGTLFLDEIGNLEPASQIKLLRLLQEAEYYPLGSDIPRKANVRILAATNADVGDVRNHAEFRRDLFYRLQTHQITLPPLRERKDDLPILTEYFIGKACDKLGKKPPAYPQELVTVLNCHAFPGNIRELEGMIFDEVSKNDKCTLCIAGFKDRVLGSSAGCPDSAPSQDVTKMMDGLATLPTITEIRQALIAEAMKRSQNNQTIAARFLGISQPALSKWLKTHADN